jgi:leukotriene-A4 hydrolase
LAIKERPTTFSFASPQPFVGQALHVKISPNTPKVNIYYKTTDKATALQWLNAEQTMGKQQPFLYSQSYPILSRTWLPCQDAPGIRFTYNATLTVPKGLLALMSSENPQRKNESGVYHFRQIHPIPSYLVAFAVGDIGFKSIDKRTGVYAEPVILNKAAWEFADMGKMVDTAEILYGPYRWGRFDVLVLPPAFPFGGTENPNLTFFTPTLLAGDRSLVHLVVHELAHSWSGNLVTNATWNDVWLNEGVTTYFERRIVEALYGKKEARMQEVLAKQALENTVAAIGDTSRDADLKGHYQGRDVNDVGTLIPYEKGYFFLRTIETAVGRPAWDSFLKNYFKEHAFQSETTEQFAAELNKKLIKGDQQIANKIRVNEWLYQPGIPKNIPPTDSTAFKEVDVAISKFRKAPVAGLHSQINSTDERLYFLSHLPGDLTADEMARLDDEFQFTQKANAEVKSAWYILAIRHHYEAANPFIEKYLSEVGRRFLIAPIYKELLKTPRDAEWAKNMYARDRSNYHAITSTTIDELFKNASK